MNDTATPCSHFPLVALLGGTFNPIHKGHIQSALEVKEALSAKELWLLPCHRPPHRTEPEVSSQQRLAMVQLASAIHPGLCVDDRELKRQQLSYTVDTLRQIRQEIGSQTSLCWVMGTDSFAGLASWHRWQDLLTFAHLVLIARPGAVLPTDGFAAELLARKSLSSSQQLHRQVAGGILLKTLTAYPISATEIRAALKQGGAQAHSNVKQWLPENVLHYIQQHRLYGCCKANHRKKTWL